MCTNVIPRQEKMEMIPNIYQLVNGLKNSYMMEYCSAVARNKVLVHATTPLNPKCIILRKRSQTQRVHIVRSYFYEILEKAQIKDKMWARSFQSPGLGKERLHQRDNGVMEMSYIMIVLLYHYILFKTNQVVPLKLVDFYYKYMLMKLIKNIKKQPYQGAHRWVSQISV